MKNRLNLLMVICGLILVITFISKMAHTRVNDFSAYYRTAIRAQHLETPYQTDGDDHPYKYPPIGIVLFFPFGVFPSYVIAKFVYGAIELGCCFAIPILAWKIIERSKPQTRVSREDFKVGVFWSFLGTLRFMDSEFQENQVGTLMALLILLGCWLLISNSAGKRWRDFAGALCIGVGGLLKFYGLIAWGEFLKTNFRRILVASSAAIALCLLLPNPMLWKEWWTQVHATGSLSHPMHDPILQGWFPFVQILGINIADSTKPFFYFMPILAALFFYLPKLGDARKQPFAFALSMMTLFIVSVSLSPLPWQHSYSTLWAFLPMIWMTLDRGLRRLFIALCVFLAVTPKTIVGATAGLGLEMNQSIYVCVLMFIGLAAFGARSIALRELSTSPTAAT